MRLALYRIFLDNIYILTYKIKLGFAEQSDGLDEMELRGKLGRKFNQSYVRFRSIPL